ncbi:MAG: tRNA 4-thiouridine(8) synthase ThiI [Nitrososphaerota archaeon]|nr:tRNA 4-thiouridine(8) synthase ThiI [Nitrososphaerota archaeon]MDG7025688.1 tRNA 4-thiouridine(8) synthase ThiI [Nitrososphaerota archaeon]
MAPEYVVHYSEVALKGKNRPEFVRALRRNIARSLSGLAPAVELRDGRFVVSASGTAQDASARLGKTFGVAWFSEVAPVGLDYDGIRRAVLDAARASKGRTFKVEPRRSDKGYPLTSRELAVRLGAAVQEETGMKVDLTSPEVVVRVDVTRSNAFVYSNKTPGPGGLPVGTAGRVMHLFSGGIDSPVAAWLLMKRGCVPVYLHFYLAPTARNALESKVTKQVKALSAYGGKSTLVLVPFAEYQLATADAPGDLEPSLFRRFMRMTAEALAPPFGAAAISTGDSLSQAASQTLWNLASFDHGSTLPILRPLLAYDKDEIIGLARRISTYDLSLEEYKDCCAIITRHPRTRVKFALVDEYVRRLKLQDLVQKVLGGATLVSYNPVGDVLRSADLADSMPMTRATGPEADL